MTIKQEIAAINKQTVTIKHICDELKREKEFKRKLTSSYDLENNVYLYREDCSTIKLSCREAFEIMYAMLDMAIMPFDIDELMEQVSKKLGLEV